jgi:hypothetical protein
MPYFADRYPETEFSKSEWLEVIGDNQPGGGEAFSLENGEASLVVEIPWRRARSFLIYALGWSYCREWKNPTANERVVDPALYRRNPVRHPRYAWLTAGTVTFNGKGPVGTTGVGTKVSGAFTSGLPIGEYDKIEATVRFVDRPWSFEDDTNLSGVVLTDAAREARRNTYFDPAPTIEIISAEGLSHLVFAYNNGPSGAPRGPGTQKIPAPFGTLMSKCTYVLNWMWVPHEFISGSDPLQFTPTRIEACTGRVNSADFMGFPTGTLLMQAPQYQRFRFPVLDAGGKRGFFGWNVKIPLQFFDPTRGNQVGVPGGTTFRGHQLLPWREDLNWYPAVRSLGGKLYPEADFNNIFVHV